MSGEMASALVPPTDAHVGVSLRRVLFVLAGLSLLLAGCASPAPPNPPAHAQALRSVLGPEREAGVGYLAVVSIDPLVHSRVPRLRSAPFRLYDERVQYLSKYDDPYLPPIALKPGLYLVVADVDREERVIEVLVQEFRYTQVNLSSLEKGEQEPEVRP